MPTPVQVRDRGAVIEVTCPFDRQVIAHLRAIPGRRWDAGRVAWRVPRTEEALAAVLAAPDAVFDVDDALVHLVLQLWPVWLSKCLTKELALISCESAPATYVERDAGGEDLLGRMNLLELQARMRRIVGEQAEGLAGAILDVFRK